MSTTKATYQQLYLLIVESPGKIKKIQSFLPKNYIVTASVGHIRDLVSNSQYKFGIDIENEFKPIYQIDSKKKEVVTKLKQQSKGKIVILASDEDREGEAIADSLRDVLNLKDKQYFRIRFNEITSSAILSAINNPSTINQPLVEAQITRRILDRLVGFELSPIINKCLKDSGFHNLGTGRVQSIVVRLIVEKEQSINNFFKQLPEIYFAGSGEFTILNKYSLKTTLYQNNHIVNLTDKLEAKKLLTNLLKSEWEITEFNKRITLSNPPIPLITSSLQQEASNRFGFSVKRTMTLAQQLYETGLITYMRTDSTILSNNILTGCQQFIENKYGKNNYQYRQYSSKNNNAQEAHEAIRPTQIEIISTGLSDDLQKLYQLIWERTVGSQMQPAKYQVYQIKLQTKDGYQMKGSLKFLLFPGYLLVTNQSNQPELEAIQQLETMKIDSNLVSISICQQLNHPPNRFNEASLVKELEQRGIGRPSTYVSIITKVQEHGYIEIGTVNGQQIDLIELHGQKNKQIKETINTINLGKENNRLLPTKLGLTINQFLVNEFPLIVDYDFTKTMENNLDLIAQGQTTRYQILNSFYHTFQQAIKSIKITKLPCNKWQSLYSIDINNLEYSVEIGKTKYGKSIRLTPENNGKVQFISWKSNLPPTKEELIKIIQQQSVTINGYKIQQGPYGYYLITPENQNISIPKNIDPLSLDSQQIEKLIESKKTITIGCYQIKIGKFGPYVLVPNKTKGKRPTFYKIPNNYNIETLTLDDVHSIIK